MAQEVYINCYGATFFPSENIECSDVRSRDGMDSF